MSLFLEHYHLQKTFNSIYILRYENYVWRFSTVDKDHKLFRTVLYGNSLSQPSLNWLEFSHFPPSNIYIYISIRRAQLILLSHYVFIGNCFLARKICTFYIFIHLYSHSFCSKKIMCFKKCTRKYVRKWLQMGHDIQNYDNKHG